MKSKTRDKFAMILFATLAIPVRSAAQERTNEEHHVKHHRYRFVDVGTFGGPTSYIANDITGTGSPSRILDRRGTVVSAADTSTPEPNYPNTSPFLPSDGFILHAFQWQRGVLTDLGTLPGGNNSFANWITANGLIAGLSENGQIDPLLGVPEVDGVLWKDDKIINLGTLEGGYESGASAVNSRGQVVGASLNTIPDPFGFGTQVRAYLWQNGTMRDLGTLGGNDAQANFINERGQVAGWSFTNSVANPVTGIPTQDPFLWENDTMLDLGTLGGTFGTPNAMNNRGQVVGNSNLAGDLSTHPFLWDGEKMIDLGTFGGDFGQANWINEAGEVVGFARNQDDQALLAFLWKDGILTNLGTVEGEACSGALSINSKSQIVGVSAKTCSFTAADRHAFLWENGHVIDLNAFLPPNAGLQQLTDAYNINDRGEIAGLGVPPGCGDAFVCGHVFVLIPCDDDHSHKGDCEERAETARSAKNPSVVIQSPTAASQIGLTPWEIWARIHARFGRNRGFGAWLGSSLLKTHPCSDGERCRQDKTLQ